MDKIDKESKTVETARNGGVDIQRWVIKLMSKPEKIDSLIEKLDDIARKYDDEYGLPVEDVDEMFSMRLTILEWLKAL